MRNYMKPETYVVLPFELANKFLKRIDVILSQNRHSIYNIDPLKICVSYLTNCVVDKLLLNFQM